MGGMGVGLRSGRGGRVCGLMLMQEAKHGAHYAKVWAGKLRQFGVAILC